MRILHILLISNCVSAIIGAIAVSTSASSGLVLTLCLVGAVASIAGMSYIVTGQFRRGLRMVEQAVASAQEGQPSKIHEFNVTWNKLGHYAQRWSVAANRSREQNKSIDWLVDTLERRTNFRSDNDTTDAGQKLRGILTGITRGADACLLQIVESIEQIQTSVKGMSEITVSHGSEVVKSTSHVENLSQSIAEVSDAATKAHDSGASVVEKTQLTQADLTAHLAAIRRIQAGVESGESRLRAMLSHTREIGAIANSIADISSRTDMLALNLSIESARCAGGSRGSSNVAEEVRRLAEQAAQAAQEVTCLVESVQLETQESIATIAQQNKDLTAELSQIESANNMLKDVANSVSGAATHLKAIGTASYGQIRLTSQLVTVVEEISRSSSICREQSETAVWNAGSLATVTAQFDELLEPLRDICLPRNILPDDRPQPRPVGKGTAGKSTLDIDGDPDHLHEELSVATRN